MTPGPLEFAAMDERAKPATKARTAGLVQRKGVPSAFRADAGRQLPEWHPAIQVVPLLSRHAAIVAPAVSAAATVHQIAT